ncbi:MAG TPA: MBL fold metallo-hydrolase, partial [Chloroflexota bacterium]|nr:MBL fold metallo-hydrolase [Chloroflexota bacterium]
MAIQARVLGNAGRDNAAFLRVDTGQTLSRLLLDCGQGCPDTLGTGEIQAVDHLLFSHLHMDHVAGFDSFFRRTYNRTALPNHIWGPPGTARILHHRFQGYLWNLHHSMAGTWHVHDVSEERVESHRFELSEAFAVCHEEGHRPRTQTILETADYWVEAFVMNHLTPSLAYLIRELPRVNVDVS